MTELLLPALASLGASFILTLFILERARRRG